MDTISALDTSVSVFDNQTLVATFMDITRSKVSEDSTDILASSVADSEEEASTSSCSNLESRVCIGAESDTALDRFAGRKTEGGVHSEEDETLSLEGDQFFDSSVASETSSLCGEDFLGLEVVANSLEVEKRLCSSIEILAGAASELLCESTVREEFLNGPLSMAMALEEDGLSPSLKIDSTGVILQSPLSTQLSGAVGRSVFEVEYVPLWGFTSFCGRRTEMEDAVVTLPQFTRIPIEMLIGDRVLSNMADSICQQTAHFFGVYDGHGGSQVTIFNLGLNQDSSIVEK